MVVTAGLTRILAPVPTNVPPQDPVNHCVVIAVEPALAVPPDAVKVVEPPGQIVDVPVIEVGAVTVS